MVRASSKSLAEQMAARRLLEALRGSEETAWPVTGAQEERLKQQNPKGRLLELATQLKVGPPVFTVEPAVSGFVGKASLPLRNEPALVSGAYAARLAKTAEQAAAADLLKALHAWMHGERPKIAVEDPPAGAPPASAAPTLADTPRGLRGKDPRMQLNEMRQLGLIRGFSAELIEKRGPPHQPIFVMRGLVETVSGAVLHTEPVEARSKKEGELAVAGPLLALAIERSGEVAPDGRGASA